MEIDFVRMRPQILVVLLLLGFAFMFVSIHFWTEWETIYLKTEGVVGTLPMIASIKYHPIAAVTYMLSFWLIIPTIYVLLGNEASFIAWATIGSGFELVQFIVVKIKTGTLSALLASSRDMGLLTTAAVLIVLLGIVTYYLYD